LAVAEMYKYLSAYLCTYFMAYIALSAVKAGWILVVADPSHST